MVISRDKRKTESETETVLDRLYHLALKNLPRVISYSNDIGDRVEIMGNTVLNSIDINEQCPDTGNTALMMAVFEGRLSTVRFLLDIGADIYLHNKEGKTAYHISCEKLFSNIDGLQERRRQINKLLEIKKYLNISAEQSVIDNEGNTALMIAVKAVHLFIVKSLLSKGTNVNAVNNKGDTALMIAVKEGHRSIVETLLSKGANVNAVNNKGDTALMIAVKEGHRSIVETLLSKGANVNMQNKEGKIAYQLSYEKLLLSSSAEKEICEQIANLLLNSLKKENFENTRLHYMEPKDTFCNTSKMPETFTARLQSSNNTSHNSGTEVSRIIWV